MNIGVGPSNWPHPARREAWRDWAIIALFNHALLIAAAVLAPDLTWLLVIAFFLGLGFAQATLTVMHDAEHRRFSVRWWPNMLAVHTSAPIGLWVAHGVLKHRVHHRGPGVFPADEFTSSAG